MNKPEIINQLQELARITFNDKNIVLNAGMVMEDISGWDSLTHIMFLEKIEKCFAIKFSFDEMLTLNDINSVCESVLNKI